MKVRTFNQPDLAEGLHMSKPEPVSIRLPDKTVTELKILAENPLTDIYIHEPDGLTYLARKVQIARQFAERPIRKQSEDPSNRPPRGKRK